MPLTNRELTRRLDHQYPIDLTVTYRQSNSNNRFFPEGRAYEVNLLEWVNYHLDDIISNANVSLPFTDTDINNWNTAYG